MTVKIGIIGTGSIARDHMKLISQQIQDAEVTAVYDIIKESAEKAVSDFDLKATVFESAEALIVSDEVDAVMVCSKNDTHFAPIMKAIELEKMVFTEKPMTTDVKESLAIVEAEVAKNRRFLQVGFMRRFDTGYQMLKKVIADGKIGAPLMGNCRHYCAHAPTDYYSTEMVINDAFIHELDILHYLFDEDYQDVEIRFARPNSLNPSKQLKDPQLAIVTLKSGAVITVELNMNSQYGYDIQCRITGEKGSVSLPEVQSPELRVDKHITYPIHEDWSLRFVQAYADELRAFVNGVKVGQPSMPSAWDGYVATVAVDAALQSQREGGKVAMSFPEKPCIY